MTRLNLLFGLIFLCVFNCFKLKAQDQEEIWRFVDKMPTLESCNEPSTDYLCTILLIWDYLYLQNNLNMPDSEQKHRGTIWLSFVVEKNGSISSIQIENSDLNEDCEKEAIRLIKHFSERWKPGCQDGKAKRTLFTLPIEFHRDEKMLELYKGIVKNTSNEMNKNLEYWNKYLITNHGRYYRITLKNTEVTLTFLPRLFYKTIKGM